VSVGRTDDAEAKGCAADEDGFADAAGVVAAADEGIDQPPSDDEIGDGCEEPGEAGVQERVEQVYVEGDREIAWQPGQQEIEDVVVGAEPEDHAEDFALPEEITEGGLWCFFADES